MSHWSVHTLHDWTSRCHLMFYWFFKLAWIQQNNLLFCQILNYAYGLSGYGLSVKFFPPSTAHSSLYFSLPLSHPPHKRSMSHHVKPISIWAGPLTRTGLILTAADPLAPSKSTATWQVCLCVWKYCVYTFLCCADCILYMKKGVCLCMNVHM